LPFAVNAPVDWVPDTAFEPVHEPDAVHAVAFVAVHVSVDVEPEATLVGEAVNVNVGAGNSETVTDCVAEPPEPVHVSVYVPLVVNAPVDCVPDVAFEPVHEPDAVQAVAFVVLQLSVDAEPDATLVGDAVNVSVGALGAAIETEADFVTVPPAPEHARV